MFQPMACRSKPQVNRLQEELSSHQVEQHTMRRWPWATTDTTAVQHVCPGTGSWAEEVLADWTVTGRDSPVCCFVGAEPVAPRTCRTDGPVDYREAERWFSGSLTRWSWTEQEELQLKQIRLESQSSATFSSRNYVFITNFVFNQLRSNLSTNRHFENSFCYIKC